ncbi:pentachlorophenol monooxygenase [Skermania sp. ID1734]|uniref:FAD-dependent monooxygenase n=1 Tax=Skermania sp. ID1734 TaxID=2597516 RepID=UPI00117D3D79|nr:FAD-dependent monooxygenase [Skermania sp. ID1734]TSD98144.1 pentachlorophenol monooxygenase [Skermania sp. ID1734]
MMDTEVLVVGAGPVGLSAAIELTRRGVACRIIDPLLHPPQYAKAVGIQPRTLEVFESMGVVDKILDAAVEMRGQLVYVNGTEVARLDLRLPEDVPFRFIGLPQYATERVLAEHLASLGVTVERGTRLLSFSYDVNGVTAVLATDSGDTTATAGYLVGCDGAHSVVRKGLGLTFEGGAFTEQYMLGDVEVDWSMPRGYGIRSMHQTDGVTDDLLVCIPLPGHRRYRMSMLVPDDLATDAPAPGTVAHGFEGERKPTLAHIQAVLDRLSPQPVQASNLRWSSVFRISHRLVDSYGRGRVFVAGDAAHIHPPTGAQGMNTGIQDAHNLAWKLALAVRGFAADDLLESYNAERHPIGEEVVGRTVRSARQGIGADSSDPDFVMRREAQLLLDYGDSPIISGDDHRLLGRRAPDATGLTRPAVSFGLRLLALLDSRHHTLLCYLDAPSKAAIAALEQFAAQADSLSHGQLQPILIAGSDTDVDSEIPVIIDAAGTFAQAYDAADGAVYLIRPDGYVGHVSAAHFEQTADGVARYLKSIFR